MITIIRTNPENIDFIHLISELDKDIKIRDGEEHSFYDQFNDSIKHAIVAYCGKAVGSGALSYIQGVEIKKNVCSS
jgi:hypothetical protein